METIVVKLGSSIVCADDGSISDQTMDSVCSRIAALREQQIRVVPVTSGAIARGVRILGLPACPTLLDQLQARSDVGQGDLFRQYEQRLARDKAHAAQVLLTADDLKHKTSTENTAATIAQRLDWGVVPVINENDTTATDEITFGDNDFLAAQVSELPAE